MSRIVTSSCTSWIRPVVTSFDSGTVLMCSSFRAVRLSTGSMVAQMLLASLLERATGGKGRGELEASSSEVPLIVADMVFRIALSLGGVLLKGS